MGLLDAGRREQVGSQLLTDSVGQGHAQRFLTAKSLVKSGSGSGGFSRYRAESQAFFAARPPQTLRRLQDPFFEIFIRNRRHAGSDLTSTRLQCATNISSESSLAGILKLRICNYDIDYTAFI